MKILITSGGTKIPIDKVRDITNQSNGTFGSRIATEALQRNHEVLFLRAEGSKSPYSVNLDFNKNSSIQWSSTTNDIYNFYGYSRHLYREYGFRNYSDYAEKLEQIIKLEQPDVVVLAAAVSDYAPKDVVNGKIRSKEDLTIKLEPVPKLISKIKEWMPSAFLVGFKMLVGATNEELIQAASESIEKNGCDFVVANDWETFLSGVPEMHIVRKGAVAALEVGTYNKNNAILERVILDNIQEWSMQK